MDFRPGNDSKQGRFYPILLKKVLWSRIGERLILVLGLEMAEFKDLVSDSPGSYYLV